MNSFRVTGKQIFFLTENDRYPDPDRNSAAMLAIREDEENQHWLYVRHDQSWTLISEIPFKTSDEAIEAAINFNFYSFRK